MKFCLPLFLCLIFLSCNDNDPSANGYIYASFTGNGEDGLHLLASYDGYDWKEVNGYQSLYRQTDGLVRDPSIVKGGDGKYHMIHTTEWFGHRVAVTHSDDLINWTPTEFLYVWGDYKGIGTEESDGSSLAEDNINTPVERDSLVKNCWAPEIFYDNKTKEYIIFWATTIEHPDVFPETWNPQIWENMNHRMYYIVTKDFKTYSPRRLFYAPKDHMVIDAFVAKVDEDNYVMAIKEETEQALHIVKSQRKLDTWENLPKDLWGDLSETNPFAGPKVPGVEARSEGPTILRNGNDWLIYCDYWNIKGNGVFKTTDFQTITNISDQLKLPRWIRHGTVLQVPKSEVDRLLAYKTADPGLAVEPIPQPKWRNGHDLYP